MYITVGFINLVNDIYNKITNWNIINESTEGYIKIQSVGKEKTYKFYEY